MSSGAYHPYLPVRRPGGHPSSKPRFRLLVHHKLQDRRARVPVKAAQEFYDHVSQAPGAPPLIKTSTVLRGKAGAPKLDGFSRTIHYEVSGAGRIDYQYNEAFSDGRYGDRHAVVLVIAINLSSH